MWLEKAGLAAVFCLSPLACFTTLHKCSDRLLQFWLREELLDSLVRGQHPGMPPQRTSMQGLQYVLLSKEIVTHPNTILVMDNSIIQ